MNKRGAGFTKTAAIKCVSWLFLTVVIAALSAPAAAFEELSSFEVVECLKLIGTRSKNVVTHAKLEKLREREQDSAADIFEAALESDEEKRCVFIGEKLISFFKVKLSARS